MMKSLWPKPKSFLHRFWPVLVVALGVSLLVLIFGRRPLTQIVSAGWRLKQTVVGRSQPGLALESQMRTNELERQILATENDKLRTILGRVSTPSKPKTVAYVLSREGVSLHQTILIDVGSTNGNIAVGDRVLADHQLILGEVVEVLPRQSKIRLLSAPGNTVMVNIGEANLGAEASGLGDGNFRARLPRAAAVKAGDYVRSLNFDPRFLVGEVVEIKEIMSEPFIEVFFRLPVNLHQLDLVEIYGV